MPLADFIAAETWVSMALTLAIISERSFIAMDFTWDMDGAGSAANATPAPSASTIDRTRRMLFICGLPWWNDGYAYLLPVGRPDR
jgi:hypothetical protein